MYLESVISVGGLKKRLAHIVFIFNKLHSYDIGVNPFLVFFILI